MPGSEKKRERDRERMKRNRADDALKMQAMKELLQTLLADKVGQEWSAIETAPKDGSSIWASRS